VRAVLLVVFVALIGAGALYILSGGHRDASEASSIASTLKEMTARVVSPSNEEGTAEASGDGSLGLGGWLGGDDPEVTPSNKDVYYQYVDDSGTVHFVQNLGDVPARWQSRAGRIEVEKTAPAPGRGGSRTAANGRAAAKSSARNPVAYRTQPEVVVYTTTWCGWCRKTLAFLDERGVRYVNKDIEANDWNRDELIEKTGRTSIPVVEINGEIIRGFNAERMEQLLAGSG
jgi:glutaredoxin-like YruB-family protein